MNEFRADLHCHSTCSDGTYTPEDLVKHAYEIGLKGLAITDHDTVASYRMAAPVAESVGIDLIPGVEFSTYHRGMSIHILGYSFDPEDHAIQELCRRQSERRLHRNAMILEKLNQHKISIDMDEVIQIAKHAMAVGRPHIAQAMIRKGYVETVQEAFQKFLGEGKKAFVPSTTIGVQETIDAIHHGGGFAILAHPHLIARQKILRELLEMDFDGLECYYSRFPKEKNQKWVQIAEKKDWLTTGGSDFHGEIKPDIKLGCAWVDLTAFEKLKRKR